MKERDVDNVIRQALRDAIKLDMQNVNPQMDESIMPSAQHQKEMAEMLKDPNGWVSRRLENANLDA